MGVERSLVVTSATLLGARTLLGAPGLTSSNKKLLGTSALLVVTSATLVGWQLAT